MRRLLVPSAEDYDDQEYEEAAEEFLSAMKKLVAHSRCAHKLACMPGELPDRTAHTAGMPGMPCTISCQPVLNAYSCCSDYDCHLLPNRGALYLSDLEQLQAGADMLPWTPWQ